MHKQNLKYKNTITRKSMFIKVLGCGDKLDLGLSSILTDLVALNRLLNIARLHFLYL